MMNRRTWFALGAAGLLGPLYAASQTAGKLPVDVVLTAGSQAVRAVV